jgi:hypothetical protein
MNHHWTRLATTVATSCLIVTAHGKLIMAGFDYDLKSQEIFPFDQAKARYSMHFVKKWLPELYGRGMLRGIA